MDMEEVETRTKYAHCSFTLNGAARAYKREELTTIAKTWVEILKEELSIFKQGESSVLVWLKLK